MALHDIARGLIKPGVHCYVDLNRCIYSKSVHIMTKDVTGVRQGEPAYTAFEFDAFIHNPLEYEALVTLLMFVNGAVRDGDMVTVGLVPDVTGAYVNVATAVNDYERHWRYSAWDNGPAYTVLPRGVVSYDVNGVPTQYCYVDVERSVYGKTVHVQVKHKYSLQIPETDNFEFDVFVHTPQEYQTLVTLLMYCNAIVRDGNMATAGLVPNKAAYYVVDNGVNTADYERCWVYVA